MSYYRKYEDRIIILSDKDGDGVAETRQIFADKFNEPLDGVASGIMVWEGKTYFGCIPNIYLMEDKNKDGDKCDEFESQVAM